MFSKKKIVLALVAAFTLASSVTILAETNEKPVITGTNSVTVAYGDYFDPFQGVSATDAEDGDLTYAIGTNGNVSPWLFDEVQYLTYSVTDSDGNVTTVTRSVTFAGFAAPAENQAPELLGVSNVTVAVNADFDKLQNISARDVEDGDLTNQIVVSGSLDLTEAGTYTLVYSVTDSEGLTTTLTRVVTVVDQPNTAPQIQGVADVTIVRGNFFDVRAGVIAFDQEDGDLTSKITVTGTVNVNEIGEYDLTYTVVDSRGLSTSVERTVTVSMEANLAPNILGAYDVDVVKNTYFNVLDGVVAFDPEDGDLTDEIEVTGTVNMAVVGRYTVVYKVTDSRGLAYEVSRIVNVTDVFNTAPEIFNAFDQGVVFGSEFNPLTLVASFDNEDGELTPKIEVTGEVNTKKAGDYDITYSVTDANGATTEVEVTITVLEEGIEPPYEVIIRRWSREEALTGIYYPHSFVVHNSKLYVQTSGGVALFAEPGVNTLVWKEVTK